MGLAFGSALYALWVVGKMVVCAVIAFFGSYWILSAWFDRRISGREAILLALGLLVLTFFGVSLAVRSGSGILLLAAAVFGTALTLRQLARGAERRIGESLDMAEVAKYQEAVANYPDNPHAHSLLADTYRGMDEIELALQEYEAALEIDASLKQERYWAEKLKTDLERRGRRGMSCPRCGALRPRKAAVCPECGRLYSTAETWWHALSVMDPYRKAILLGIGGGAVAAIAAIVSLAPGTMKLAATLILVLAPVAIIIMSVRMRRHTG